jgi:tetratricopeptide (TPR) repeat protein
MNFAEQLRILQAAQGDPAKLALATVDLKYPELPQIERAMLKTTLEAAAIPHWCDASILSSLLQIPSEDSAARLAYLRGLTVVEPFPARGETAVNVHESARLALRQAIFRDSHERFHVLSGRAGMHFEEDLTPAGRIEWIYQLLCAEPDHGASELEKLKREWSTQAPPDDRYALSAALKELDDTELVAGRARVWVLLTVAWSRATRGGSARLGATAAKALALACSVRDLPAKADALRLRGAVLMAQGKLAEAQTAFEEYLAISQELAEQDPSNTGWQRELAIAHSQVGWALQEQDKLEEAEAPLGEYLALSQRFMKLHPSHLGWQRELAVAHGQVGVVLQAQGKLAEAQVAFGKCLSISQRLAAHDPTNADWQRELAVAHGQVGGVLQAQGKLAEAQVVFEEHLAISQWLTAQDPSHLGWQRELAVAHGQVGGVLQAQGKLAEAQAAFEEYLAISQRLTEQDLSNADWQRELAMAHGQVGAVLQAQGKLAEAQTAFGKRLAINRRLVAQVPSSADWQRELAAGCFLLGRLEVKADRYAAALLLFEEASGILGESPGSAQWANDKKQVEAQLRLCQSKLSSEKMEQRSPRRS